MAAFKGVLLQISVAMGYNSQQWNTCICKVFTEPYHINIQDPKLQLPGHFSTGTRISQLVATCTIALLFALLLLTFTKKFRAVCQQVSHFFSY